MVISKPPLITCVNPVRPRLPKKAGRTAAEGIVVAKVSADGKTGILLEVNSETDFVARDDNFLKFANGVADRVLATKETDVAKLLETAMEEGGSDSIETTRSALVQKIGENIQVRRTYVMESEGLVSAYVHSGKIGVLVALNGGNDDLGKDVAMHVAASNPLVVNPDQVDQATLDKEKEIFSAQAAESGKPPEIVEKNGTGPDCQVPQRSEPGGPAFCKRPGYHRWQTGERRRC